jgi:hypothetical protein
VRPRGGEETVVLAGSGAAIWEMLEVPKSVPELAAALADRFRCDPEAITSDVQGALTELGRRQVLRFGDP